MKKQIPSKVQRFLSDYHRMTISANRTRHFIVGKHFGEQLDLDTNIDIAVGDPMRLWVFPDGCEVHTDIAYYPVGAMNEAGKDFIELSIIFGSPNCYGRGYPTKVMNDIGALLDKYDLGMYLVVDAPNAKKLYPWYGRFGFQYVYVDGTDLDMVRFPKTYEGLWTPAIVHTWGLLKEEIPEFSYQIKQRNPRRRRNGTRLVPKEQVRMKGFDRKKTAIVEPEIPHVLALIEQMLGKNLLFPTPIRPMSKAEFANGRSTIDSGHPMGAGHGQYDTIDKEVAINGHMEPFDLITNVFHENLHHARPDLSEEVVRDTTGEAMLYLYGEYNLGRPYAEERRENPRRNRKAETRDSKGRLIPQKYLDQYKGKRLKARIEEIGQRRDEYEAALDKYGDEDRFPRSVLKKLYRPFETDKGVVSKKSNYTTEAHKRGFTGDLKQKQRSASHYYGGTIPKKVLKTVMDRGRAAWASGGHRAGQTPESWGYARVNSFLVGGKTFWTADTDQVKLLPKKVAMNVASQSVYSPSLSVLWD